MPEIFRCRLRHAHRLPARRDECDGAWYDQRGFEKLSAVDFVEPPRVLIEEFPGVVETRGTLDVVVFSREQILPHELE